MNSMEEDALFSAWGWEKNLIQRQFEAPDGHYITFDTLMSMTESPAGERELIQIVQQFGVRDATRQSVD